MTLKRAPDTGFAVHWLVALTLGCAGNARVPAAETALYSGDGYWPTWSDAAASATDTAAPAPASDAPREPDSGAVDAAPADFAPPCTPTCAGIACGSGDGCGNPCLEGSGCQVPVGCARGVDSDTLALYLAAGSGSVAVDETSNHPGTVVGSGVTRGAGYSDCGKAFTFTPTNPPSYVLLPNHVDWQLNRGSVEFWVFFDRPAGSIEGLVSRDANGTVDPGHFTVYRACNGSLVARLQRPSGTFFSCSQPVPAGTWRAVGVNFGAGGLEIYAEGTSPRTTPIQCGNQLIDCGTSSEEGIAGNNNPWVIGAEAMISQDGSATPNRFPLKGRIDAIRISRTRRNFAGP